MDDTASLSFDRCGSRRTPCHTRASCPSGPLSVRGCRRVLMLLVLWSLSLPRLKISRCMSPSLSFGCVVFVLLGCCRSLTVATSCSLLRWCSRRLSRWRSLASPSSSQREVGFALSGAVIVTYSRWCAALTSFVCESSLAEGCGSVCVCSTEAPCGRSPPTLTTSRVVH